MLRVLLESNAAKQRRTAGAALSAVFHVGVIAAATVGTVHGKAAPPEKPRVYPVHIVPPKPREIHREPRTTSARATPTLPSGIVIRHVDAPPMVPKELPPIDMTAGVAGDSIIIGGGDGGASSSLGGLYAADPQTESRDWDVRELLMHVISQGRPRYPEALRSAGVDGRVLVQFSVDTTGRVDPASVKILESTHELFSRAVREALGSFRFRPAEVGGRRVAALAQMPFEFRVDR